MTKFLTLLVLVLTACSGSSAETTTLLESTTTSTQSVTTTTIGTTTTIPLDCPAAPYELTTLPFGVGQGVLDPDEIEPDAWTSVGGTNTTFWGRGDGTVAIALVRGTLPAIDWPGEKGEVSIDGTRGVAGPHPDGIWAVGWFEQPGDRCDLYTMVFYPPVAPNEVESTLLGTNRVGG